MKTVPVLLLWLAVSAEEGALLRGTKPCDCRGDCLEGSNAGSLGGEGRTFDDLLKGIDVDDDFMKSSPALTSPERMSNTYWVAGMAFLAGIFVGFALLGCVLFAVKLFTETQYMPGVKQPQNGDDDTTRLSSSASSGRAASSTLNIPSATPLPPPSQASGSMANHTAANGSIATSVPPRPPACNNPLHQQLISLRDVVALLECRPGKRQTTSNADSLGSPPPRRKTQRSMSNKPDSSRCRQYSMDPPVQCTRMCPRHEELRNILSDAALHSPSRSSPMADAPPRQRCTRPETQPIEAFRTRQDLPQPCDNDGTPELNGTRRDPSTRGRTRAEDPISMCRKSNTAPITPVVNRGGRLIRPADCDITSQYTRIR